MKIIEINDGKYDCLSNFSAHQIVINGHNWPTSEHAYQQSKFLKVVGCYEIRDRIRKATSPAKAKEIAHQNRKKYFRAWRLPSFKIYTMKQILLAKALQHEEVLNVLIQTGTSEIVEISPNDSFWGSTNKGPSHNWLGKSWMWVRTEVSQMELDI